MTVTAFGGLFLPLCLFVFLFRRAWLLPLLCVAAVLQSPSAADVSWRGQALGITPFLAVASLIGLDLVRRIVSDRRFDLADGERRRLVWLWLGSAAVSVLGALVLPWLFAGASVHLPLAKSGTQAAPEVLRWSISNLAQIVHVLLMLAVGLWVLLQRKNPSLPRYMLIGMMAAVAVSVVVGLQQRLGWNGTLPLWEGFWASNPTYDQNFRTWAGPIPRVSWPLVEASYASAWFAAVLGGFLAMFVADAHRHAALVGVMLTTFALGNTLGATGLIATVVYGALLLVVIVVLASRYPALRGGLSYRLTLATLVFGCLGLSGFLILRHYGLLDAARGAVDNILQGRSQTVLGDIRPLADRHALILLRDTWGLGVGMGSNRASSYLVTLASTSGVLGLSLFLLAFAYQMRLLVRRVAAGPDTASVFFLGASAAGLIAVTIAIPDQNWPVFQILLLGGFVCVMSKQESAQDQTSPDAQRAA